VAWVWPNVASVLFLCIPSLPHRFPMSRRVRGAGNAGWRPSPTCASPRPYSTLRWRATICSTLRPSSWRSIMASTS
jgi:hypothetical protein